jgi:hypothetical protein
MLDMHFPKSYWGDALLTATYLINRMPSRFLDFQTPLEVLSPPLSTVIGVSPKFFGCVCFVYIHGPARSKLDPRSLKCVFVGYSSTQKGYKCYHPPSRKYFVSMDVTFFEQQSYSSSTPTPLQGESQIEEGEDFLSPLPVPILMLEPEQQQITNESPTEPIDQPCAPPVEELRVYSRRQKAKTIPDATCQTSDLGSGTTPSGTTPSTFDMNFVIPVVNDSSLPIHNAKELGHVHTIQCLILFLINIYLHHIVPLYSNCLLCLFLEIYRRHLMIQNGGQRCMKRWKLFTRTRLGIWSNYLMERRLLAASGCSLSSISPMVRGTIQSQTCCKRLYLD